jgi:hypothetical protein
VRPRWLNVHAISPRLSLRSRSRVVIVADDRNVFLLALPFDSEHGFRSVVAVWDFDADPFAFAVGSGAADFAFMAAD